MLLLFGSELSCIVPTLFIFIYMKYNLLNENIDLSEVGQIWYEWDFDREEYEDYLAEEGLQDNQETLMEYINDCVSFEIDLKDNETFHSMGLGMSLDYNELCDEFGEGGANTILNDCMRNGEGYIETSELLSSEIDINNPTSLNQQAKALLSHGDYFKGCRGFILTDGTVIYTESEHNEVTRIYGIESKFQFIRLGNIRIMPQSIDLSKEPTEEQWDVIRQVINSYAGMPFYLDIFSERDGEIGVQYSNADWRYICGEIKRYFREGIRPQGRMAYENKKRRNIIITESQCKRLFKLQS